MKLLLAYNPRPSVTRIAHPNVKLTSCGICDAHYDHLREHCPVCGARRQFLANHSYEPTRVIVRAIAWEHGSREIVRAIRSDIGFKFVQQ